MIKVQQKLRGSYFIFGLEHLSNRIRGIRLYRNGSIEISLSILVDFYSKPVVYKGVSIVHRYIETLDRRIRFYPTFERVHPALAPVGKGVHSNCEFW